MYLGPLLDGQCLRDYPPNIDFKPVEIVKRNETAAGYIKTHRTGFRYTFTLDWSNSLVSEEMYAILINIANKNSVVSFIPYPDKYYSSSYSVRLVNSLSGLKPFKYIHNGYRGTINLETVTPIYIIPQWTV